ncbi:LPS assembly protein LptD [Aquisalimonas sp.]|uniref:LPS-assembly protein LptD n=1 Tax=Aquisalimonas sp. TaxID=1872621 RepID=UPI0025BA2AC2|nr:LPS assembly protein LptD [Aquisalimonas sp.]
MPLATPAIRNGLVAAALVTAVGVQPLGADSGDDNPQWPLLSGDNGRWAGCIAPMDGAQIGATRSAPSREGAEAIVDADTLDYDGGVGVYSLRGNVELERADQRLRADAMRFDEREQRADALGDLRYRETGLRLGASQGFLLLDDDTGEMDQVRYLLPETLTQGEADRIQLLDAGVSMAHDTTYSTCEPGNEAWMLRADRVRLNRDTGTGEAWHARLTVRDFPVAYTPYVNFPIDDRRKSGLLPATLRQSDRSGTDITVPYYWNIAPNYDATLAPRYLSRRGFMLGGEFRYLQPSFSGEVDGSYLPEDDRTGEDRWQFGLDHRHRFSPNVRGDLQLARVSDDQYFRDFGDSLRTSTTRHLRSRGRLRYDTYSLSGVASAEIYQTVDPALGRTQRPYQRLPRLELDHRPDDGPLGLRLETDSELVRFDHPTPDERITGVRADIAPRLSRPFVGLAGFFTPAVTLRHTQYDLDSASNADSDSLDTTDNENPSRTVPVASLDTGLVFERHFSAFDLPLRQTLEPRLFYLYVPERDQSELPLFDTGEAVPGLFQFFSENRFSGRDRVGDANQVTAGLTSRFLSRETGQEFLRLGVAQVRYFEDRRVMVDRDPRPQDERDYSDVIAEARATLPNNLRASTEIQWNPDTERTSLSGVRLSYQPRPDSIITTSYRARRDIDDDLELEQRDISVAWPVHPRWHVLGGWRYSMLEDRTLESFGGLQYRDCCWSVRLLGRYYREEPEVEPERSIMLQFELRGLGSLGDDIQGFLEDSMFGYGRRR